MLFLFHEDITILGSNLQRKHRGARVSMGNWSMDKCLVLNDYYLIFNMLRDGLLNTL